MKLLFAKFIGGLIAFLKITFMLIITWLFLPAIFVFCAMHKKELQEFNFDDNMKDVNLDRLN